MLMHLRIKQKKIRLIGKVMAKNVDNMCRKAPRKGVRECNRDDLLNECKNLSAELRITDVTKGFFHKEII